MLNKDLLPTPEFLDSIHYGIAPADDPTHITGGNLKRSEAIALANSYTDESAIQFVAVDLLTGEIVEAE